MTVEPYQVTYCKCGMGEIDFPSIPKLCCTILTPKVFHLLIIDQLQDSSHVTVEQNQVTFRALLIFVGWGKMDFPSFPKLCCTILTPKVFHLCMVHIPKKNILYVLVN